MSTAVSLAACTSQDEADDYEQATTIAGRWQLPSAVHTIAQTQFVAYDDAPPWDGGSSCSGAFYSGTRKVRDYLLAAFSGISSIGGYDCRQNTADLSKTSIHGTGRALDVMIPTIGGDADNTTGDAIGNWLVSHAEYVGIQLVIWDKSVWQASLSGEKLQPYGGPITHVNHLHVELTEEAAQDEATEFFRRQGSTAGDIDGDGRADLVTVHSAGAAYVYGARATGELAGAAQSFAGSLDSALVDGTNHLLVGAADVTGDGRSDLVSVHSGGSAFVWPGRPDRTFGSAASSFNGTLALATVTGAGHDPVALADVTGDGRADLVTVHTNGNVYVYPGTASGAFAGAVASFAGTFKSALRDGIGHWVVGAGDVNGDGRADLVTVHSNGTAYVYEGTATGAFGASTASFAGTMQLAVLDGQAGHVPVGIADVDGDRKADLITHYADGSIYVYRGTAGGTFASSVASFAGTMKVGQFGAPGHQAVGALDVNGDGKADLVTVFGGSAYVYFGTASGSFVSGTVNFAGTLDSSFADGVGHELVQMGTFARRRMCAATGCRAR